MALETKAYMVVCPFCQVGIMVEHDLRRKRWRGRCGGCLSHVSVPDKNVVIHRSAELRRA